MPDLRIYRAAFLPTMAMLVLLLFSLEAAPEAIETPIGTPPFEGREAARTARAIVADTPDRRPGSEGDAALARLVRERFRDAGGGEVSTQEFESSFEGEDVTLENVILRFPGESEEVVLVTAARDSAVVPDAVGSAASTAALLSLADDLADSRHARTIVLASVSGGVDGAKGARALVEELDPPEGILAAISLEAMGTETVGTPIVLAGHLGPRSTASSLIDTADELASNLFETDARDVGGFGDLASLAVPLAYTSEAVFAEAGLEAVAISPPGRRLDAGASRAGAERISSETLGAAGSTALELTLTLVEDGQRIRGGPGTYLRLGDDLLPGWTLVLLAIALIAPGVLVAGDLWLRERRRSPRESGKALSWAGERILIPLAGLLVFYAATLVGLIPDPSLPYPIEEQFPRTAGVVGVGLVALAIGGAAVMVRPLRVPLGAEPQLLAAAAGLLTGASLLAIWLINPFTALLLAPLAHVWLLAARPERPATLLSISGATLLALLPFLAGAISVGSAWEMGAELPWHLLLALASGQFGILSGLAWCGLIAGLIGILSAARAGGRQAGAGPDRAAGITGPAGLSGPGTLSGPASQRPGIG